MEAVGEREGGEMDGREVDGGAGNGVDVVFDFDEPNTPEHILFSNAIGAPTASVDLGAVLLPGRGELKLPRELKGATLTKLVERLTHPAGVEPTFVTAFLLTYRSFTSPTTLLQLLRARFAVPLPHNVSEAEVALFHSCVVKPIRLRVLNVTKHWLKHYRFDFDKDSALRDACMTFISEICDTHASYAPLARALRQELTLIRWRAASSAAVAAATASPPTANVPNVPNGRPNSPEPPATGNSFADWDAASLHPSHAPCSGHLLGRHLVRRPSGCGCGDDPTAVDW